MTTSAEKMRAWRAANPEKNRRRYKQDLWRRYGLDLTLDDFEVMLEKQGGVCAICKEPCSTGRDLAVDHDHETGVVRGLLCLTCNRFLGRIEGWRGQAALDYLRRTSDC
jgi:hypothetical protein